jgi:ubiquinol-cytochrome c reductase cytochrome b subunit
MALRDFLEERVGISAIRRHTLDAPIPGGAHWNRVFGSVLLWLLFIEFATGIALAMIYSPSAHSAWSSVFYIEHHFRWGHLVRGLHHWAGQAMLILTIFHLLVTIAIGAYKRPREVNWWAGLALAGLVFLGVHSGALLPWDQKAFWTTRVEASIASTVPIVGTFTQRMIQAGNDLTSLSVTRMYGVHVGLVPVLFLVVVLAHVALMRKHGPTPPPSFPDELVRDPEAARAKALRVGVHWPDQAARNALASVIVVGIVWWLARSKGAPLEGPADPDGDYPARPEWFLLGLYKLRHAFEGPKEIIATVIIPGLLTGYFVALPFIDRSPSRAISKRIPHVVVPTLILAAVVGYTAVGMRADARDTAFQRARQQVDQNAARAFQLAANGIPPEGPLDMVHNDPQRRPRELFEEHCAQCHAPVGTPARDAHGQRTNARAPTLDGFGTREWLRALLNNPDATDLFGRTEIHEMPSQTRRLRDDFDAVVEYVYAQSLERGDAPANEALVRRGDEVYHQRCTMCHQGAGDQSETDAADRDAPDLTGWGSRAYLRNQILHPDAPQNYGARNHMPSFADRLQGRELEWVIDYTLSLRARPAPVVAPPPPPAAAPAETPPPG